MLDKCQCVSGERWWQSKKNISLRVFSAEKRTACAAFWASAVALLAGSGYNSGPGCSKPDKANPENFDFSFVTFW